MIRKSFSFALCLTLIIAASSGCKKDDDNGGNNSADILPGIGLKDVKIGDPAQKAFDVFGTVTDSYFENGGLYYHFLLYFTKGAIIYLEPTASETLDLNTKILTIVLIDPYAGKTDKGIGIGSTKTEVIAAYGQPDSSAPLEGDIYNIGIAFEYDNDTVSSITVRK